MKLNINFIRNFSLITSMLLLVIYTFTGMLPNTSYGQLSKVSASEIETDLTYIYDEANLLTPDQLQQLQEMCATYGEDAGIDIIILTHNKPNAVYGDRYIENFYDETVYDSLYRGDSAILLIDMSERDIIIHGYGEAETYLHSKRGDVIIQNITPYLKNGEYATAFEQFIKSAAAYMKDDSELNYDHNYPYQSPSSSTGNSGNYPNSNYPSNNYSNNNYGNVYYGDSYGRNADQIFASIWFQLLISLVVGGVVVGIMAYNAGGKMTVGSNTYMDNSNSGLIGRRDTYIRTHVTRIRKPQNNPPNNGGFNSGGFHGGTSSGGHSHSSSSGKF